jgi:TolB-like protein
LTLSIAIKGTSLFLFFVTDNSVQSDNCRKEVNLADREQIPIVAIHLEQTGLPDGLDLTLSDRQAILKYDISDEEYSTKLLARLGRYQDHRVTKASVEESTGSHNLREPTNAATRARKKYLFAGFGIIAVIAIGSAVFLRTESSGVSPADQIDPAPDSVEQSMPGTLRAHTSDSSASPLRANWVAVLPFKGVAKEEDSQALAGGITADLIRDMSSYGLFSITPLRSVLPLQDSSLTVAEIAMQLGVRYLVEGAVQESTEGHRVVIAVVDGVIGKVVLNYEYSYTMGSALDVQSKAVRDIGSTLHLDLFDLEMSRSQMLDARRMTNWDLFLSFGYFYRAPTEEKMDETIDNLRLALEMEEDYGLAMAGLANLLSARLTTTSGRNREAVAEEACELADRAVALYGKQQWVLSQVIPAVATACSNPTRAANVAERAVHLNENLGYMWVMLGQALQYAGKPLEAISSIEHGEQVHDGFSGTKNFGQSFRANCYVQLEEWDQVIASAQESLNFSPGNVWSSIQLANALAVQGNLSEARKNWQNVIKRFPSFSLDNYAWSIYRSYPTNEIAELYVKGLRLIQAE